MTEQMKPLRTPEEKAERKASRQAWLGRAESPTNRSRAGPDPAHCFHLRQALIPLPMTPGPEPRRIFNQKLRVRVERLQRLLTIEATPMLIAKEIWLIFLAGMGAYPEELGQAQTTWMAQSVKPTAGFCFNAGCQNPLDPASEAAALCRSCREDPPDRRSMSRTTIDCDVDMHVVVNGRCKVCDPS